MSTTLAPPTVLPSGPHAFRDAPRPIVLRQSDQVRDVDLPTPRMGSKAWLLSEKGHFILQRGPGTLRTLAITHAGAGNLEAIDGIPDAQGFFPGQQWELPVADENENDEQFLYRLRRYHTRNGRPFYRANPIVMGSWMLDAGFNHGLTIRALGGHDSAAAIATICWMPFRERGAA